MWKIILILFALLVIPALADSERALSPQWLLLLLTVSQDKPPAVLGHELVLWPCVASDGIPRACITWEECKIAGGKKVWTLDQTELLPAGQERRWACVPI